MYVQECTINHSILLLLIKELNKWNINYIIFYKIYDKCGCKEQMLSYNRKK